MKDLFRPSGFQLDVLYALANGDQITLHVNRRGNPTDALLRDTRLVLPLRSANLLYQRGWIRRVGISNRWTITAEGLLTVGRNEKGLLDAHERPIGSQTIDVVAVKRATK